MLKSMEIMKAMKFLLIVIGLATMTILSAQTFAEQPTVEMHSTSTMMGSGSELPQAALTGVYTTYSTSSNSGVTGPNRIGEGNSGGGEGPENPDDIWSTPIGDIPWLLMALLVGGYALRVGKRPPTRASRHQR